MTEIMTLNVETSGFPYHCQRLWCPSAQSSYTQSGVTNPPLRWLLVRSLKVRQRQDLGASVTNRAHIYIFAPVVSYILHKQTNNKLDYVSMDTSFFSFFLSRLSFCLLLNPTVTHYLRQWQGGKLFLASVSRSLFPQMALKEKVFPVDEF